MASFWDSFQRGFQFGYSTGNQLGARKDIEDLNAQKVTKEYANADRTQYAQNPADAAAGLPNPQGLQPVSPDATPSSYQYLGQSFDKAPDTFQQAALRNSKLADIYGNHGLFQAAESARAAGLNAQSQGLNFGLAQRRADNADTQLADSLLTSGLQREQLGQNIDYAAQANPQRLSILGTQAQYAPVQAQLGVASDALSLQRAAQEIDQNSQLFPLRKQQLSQNIDYAAQANPQRLSILGTQAQYAPVQAQLGVASDALSLQRAAQDLEQNAQLFPLRKQQITQGIKLSNNKDIRDQAQLKLQQGTYFREGRRASIENKLLNYKLDDAKYTADENSDIRAINGHFYNAINGNLDSTYSLLNAAAPAYNNPLVQDDANAITKGEDGRMYIVRPDGSKIEATTALKNMSSSQRNSVLGLAQQYAIAVRTGDFTQVNSLQKDMAQMNYWKALGTAAAGKKTRAAYEGQLKILNTRLQRNQEMLLQQRENVIPNPKEIKRLQDRRSEIYRSIDRLDQAQEQYLVGNGDRPPPEVGDVREAQSGLFYRWDGEGVARS